MEIWKQYHSPLLDLAKEKKKDPGRAKKYQGCL